MSNSNTPQNYLLPALGLVLVIIAAVFVSQQKQPQSPQAGWHEGWKQLPPFSFPRRALAAVVGQGHLYVVGGVDASGNYVREVEYAKILDNGEIGEWNVTSPLSQGRFYLAAVSANGFLYALGGGAGPLGGDNIPVNTVERAKIKANGSLGPWQPAQPLLTPRRGLKAITLNNRIYATGGYNGTFLKNTEHAVVSADGELLKWNMDAQESSIDRYIHSSAVFGNFLYVLGGHVEKSDHVSYGDVEVSEVMDNGFLSPWFIAKSRLQMPRFIASAFALNNKLYILGGHNGAKRLHTVEMAPIHRNGHIGQFEFVAPLNVGRSAAAVAVYANRIYVLGGMSDNQVLNTVETAMQNPQGRLGN